MKLRTFSISSLLLLVTIVAVACALVSANRHRALEAEQAAATLREKGYEIRLGSPNW